MLYHFSLKSKRSRELRYRKDAYDSSRLSLLKVTNVVDQCREPHHSESVTIERSHEVSVHYPFLEASVHKVEVEVLIRIRPRVNDAALNQMLSTLS